ncbi:MAG TPA: SprT family zinc-dependent metalloprotease, partial [Longimicrobiales bacterium]|nr:SprT family zinc-dependent metalloprotease [Longimicrobiales bacterium]
MNRTVLLSISRDGRTLNSHACFRDAPQPVVDAVAIYLTSRRGSTAGRRALEHLRSWEGTRRGLADARRQRPARRLVRHDGPETAPLRGLFDAFNRERFGGALPRIPLRVSHRMRRTLGSARYGGEGVVEEIAICADLLLPGNREVLEDTMLHEMAHAEAWIRHGHRGHGKVWKTI